MRNYKTYPEVTECDCRVCFCNICISIQIACKNLTAKKPIVRQITCLPLGMINKELVHDAFFILLLALHSYQFC